MKKSYFYIFKIKKLLLPFILTLFTICLILFSTSNLSAAKKGLTLWRCKCDCGNEKITTVTMLNAGKTSSCGCYQHERQNNKGARQ